MREFFIKLFVITRWLVIALPVVLLIWLIRQDLVLSGSVSFTYDFKHDSAVITNLFPANRLSAVNHDASGNFSWQSINQEPVYFETRLPQQFDTATVQLTYQNPGFPLIQIGLRSAGDDEWNYQLKPVENQQLDQLKWFKIETSQATLWQKTPTFLSFGQFYDNLATLKNLASYDYEINRKFILPNYQPTIKAMVLDKTIRGNHSFYTYLKNELLNWQFIYQDINRNVGSDPIKVNVYNFNGQQIYHQEIFDDGNVTRFGPASVQKSIFLKIPNLPEGAYRIELVCGDDIFIRKIVTTQQYLTFINRLYLVDNPEYADGFLDLKFKPTTVYATISRLGFTTAHPEGLQKVTLSDGQLVDLKEIHKNYFATAKSSPINIVSPVNDLMIFGRGLMALSESMYFNPEIYQLRDFSITPDIQYLVSDYHTPLIQNNWKTATVKFNLANAKIVNRKLRFVISAPELNDSQMMLPLAKITVTYFKTPMGFGDYLTKIWSYINKILKNRI